MRLLHLLVIHTGRNFFFGIVCINLFLPCCYPTIIFITANISSKSIDQVAMRTREFARNWRQSCSCTACQTRWRAESPLWLICASHRDIKITSDFVPILSEWLISVIWNKECSKGVKFAGAQRYCFEIAWVCPTLGITVDLEIFHNNMQLHRACMYLYMLRAYSPNCFEINQYRGRGEIDSCISNS